MSSVYKIHKGAGKRKREADHDVSDDSDVEVSNQVGTKASGSSSFKPLKQKVLILSSRGITARQRFLMNDIITMLPHSKKDAKLDTKSKLFQLNELAELYNCNNILFFEARKHQDLYLWVAKAPNGPCFKLHVQNLHTMDELNLTGNCLRGSRPIISFDATFDAKPHLQVLKELLSQVFNVPKGARRAKPFVDHILTLTVADGKIWFRNYQLKETSTASGATPKDSKDTSAAPKTAIMKQGKNTVELELVEIGPRFCMTIINIFEGSFTGPVIYENKEFVSPNVVRRIEKKERASKYAARRQQHEDVKAKRINNKLEVDELDDSKLFAN
ncbi:Ribosome bioproteinsis protein brx1 [Savitreella phatthalungensis]